MLYTVYILKCSDSTLYVGCTNNLPVRLKEHNGSKKGAHYTKIRRPVALVYTEEYKTLNAARKREAEIKKWRRKEKLLLISHMDYSGDDFYCEVALRGEAPLRKEYESESVLAYHHTRPHWPVHIVVVPKKHISSFVTLEESDRPVLLEIMEVLKMLAAKVEQDTGSARILTNLGKYQDSKHLHFHVSSGESLR